MSKPNKPGYVRSEWIFDWKRPHATPVSSSTALLLVAGAFALLFLSVRVKLVEPVDWAAPQASVIHLGEDPWSRSMRLEAKAHGPFPSRFELEQWKGGDDMRSVVSAALQPRLKPHQPRLLTFPEPGIQPPSMARRGEPVLPHRAWRAGQPVDVDGLELQPVLTAVDGIQATEIPLGLPDWPEPVTEILASRRWKFLIEVDAGGRVLNCVSLAGGNELSPKELMAWLKSVVFAVDEPTENPRWVSVAVEFQNQAKTP